jgi:hypothetical protein
MKTKIPKLLLGITIVVMLSTNLNMVHASACTNDQYDDNGSCLSCPANSMSPAASTGIESCKCQWNFWFTGTVCDACAANSISLMGSTDISDCNCMNYYYQDGVTCVACPTGAWSEIDTQVVQECFCEPGMYMSFAYDQCVVCPYNKTSSWYNYTPIYFCVLNPTPLFSRTLNPKP